MLPAFLDGRLWVLAPCWSLLNTHCSWHFKLLACCPLLIFFTRCLLHVVRFSLLFFAVDSSLLAASFLLFADLYSLLASRWSVLSSRCLVIISLIARHSLLSKCHTLLDACCSLFPNSLLTLVASWLLYANRGLLPAVRFALLVSHHLLLPRSLQSAWYLLYIARLLLITATCSPLTPFSLMLPVPLKRSVVFQFHIAFRFSVPVSRCPLLAIRFFCLLACYSPLFPEFLFVRYSFLDTRCWSRTDYLSFVSLW